MNEPIPGDYYVQQTDILLTENRMQHERISALEAQNQLLRKALTGACHALRSYQYGNSATDLAEEAANAIDAALAATEPKP